MGVVIRYRYTELSLSLFRHDLNIYQVQQWSPLDPHFVFLNVKLFGHKRISLLFEKLTQGILLNTTGIVLCFENLTILEQ